MSDEAKRDTIREFSSEHYNVSYCQSIIIFLKEKNAINVCNILFFLFNENIVVVYHMRCKCVHHFINKSE